MALSVSPHISHLPLRLLLAVLLAVFISSCKSAKKTAEIGSLKGLTARTIIANHYDRQLDFNTLSGKIKIAYSEGGSTQSVGVSLRMQKDKAIWISAPLGIIKAYLTPERVSFYNKLQNEYFDGDYSYFSEMLGIDLDFDKVQNLLVGQTLLDMRDMKFDAESNGEFYSLTPKRNPDLIKLLYLIEPENFLLARQQLSQPEKKRLLDIHYRNYQTKGDKTVPLEIGIVAIETVERTFIDITYRNIEFNRQLNFPYRIPKGYDEIVLK